VVAIERGTPLADVLRAQATDVREVGKRALLEAGDARRFHDGSSGIYAFR